MILNRSSIDSNKFMGKWREEIDTFWNCCSFHPANLWKQWISLAIFRMYSETLHFKSSETSFFPSLLYCNMLLASNIKCGSVNSENWKLIVCSCRELANVKYTIRTMNICNCVWNDLLAIATTQISIFVVASSSLLASCMSRKTFHTGDNSILLYCCILHTINTTRRIQLEHEIRFQFWF